MKELSPTEIEVMKHSFTAIPEQMGASLQRSAYSPNIKERKDESCAIFTSSKDMLAQAEHIPVHLGAMPSALEVAVEECEIKKNCQIVLNDPYAGGTHLPDITVIKPVYMENNLLGYVVNRAHHADVGGKVPGSMPGNSKTLEEEGIVISPQYLVEDDEIVEKALNMIKKARSPDERVGDIRAQIGSNEMGASEFIKTVKKFGLDDYKTFTKQILEYSETRTRKVIEDLPDGNYDASDFMEWERDVHLNVNIEIKKDEINFDFSGTDEQVEGNINAPKPVTMSAVYYILRCLLPDDIPINNGCYNPVNIKVPKGSLLNPTPPAAVSAGNVETSQNVVELILKALREAVPDRIPAGSEGTMNNLIIGNDDFTYYETIGGGAGGSPQSDGESGVQVHMTNTKNTPIEALENDYPLIVRAYHLRKNSGGDGKYIGGDGIIREIEVLEDSFLSIQSGRRTRGPEGIKGGKSGARGKNILIKDDSETELDGKVTKKISVNDRIRIETPGGGGWGKP